MLCFKKLKIYPEGGGGRKRKKEKAAISTKRKQVWKLALVLVFVEALSLALTYRALKTSRTALKVFKQVVKFQESSNIANDNAHLTGLVAGYSSGGPRLWHYIASGFVEDQIHDLDKLDKQFHRLQKESSSQGFRLELSKHFHTMRKNYEAYYVVQQDLIDYVTISNEANLNKSFDAYVWGVFATNEQFVDAARSLAADSLLKLVDKTYKSASEKTTYIVSLVGVLLILVTLFFVWALHKVAQTSFEIEACDKCVRQQAHEIRNRLSPAMFVFEQFLELLERQDVTISDFQSHAHDMSLAFMALKEVEGQLQARLDIFKILTGKYASKPETIDICELMSDRLEVEHAIAVAKSTNAGKENDVKFLMKTNGFQDCNCINVRTDLYILNHIITNLISNSRKFCHFGEIVITFHGEFTQADKKLLRFTCSDTGTGLPPQVAKNLFSKGSISGDNRGTGLGMPSCSVFVQAIGGWIRVKETRQQQFEQGISGYTEFEFAIAGHVVSAEKHSPPKETMNTAATPSFDTMQLKQQSNTKLDRSSALSPLTVRQSVRQLKALEDSVQVHKVPNDIVVVIVDDSSLNRTCLQSRLKKVQAELNAVNWEYKHFETFENAMPFFRKIHELNQVAIVTLDEDYSSRGGVMSGLQGTRWLFKDLGFKSIVISSSGDEDIGLRHLELGAQLNWAKPLKNYKKLLSDIVTVFASR